MQLFSTVDMLLDVECGKLSELAHGSITLTDNRTSFGAVANYTCEANYTLVGDEQRMCGDNGIWSGLAPQCLCKKILKL